MVSLVGAIFGWLNKKNSHIWLCIYIYMSITKYLLFFSSDISSEPFKASGMNKLSHLSRVANDTWIPNLKFKYPDYHLFVEDVFVGASWQDHMWKDVCSVLFFFPAITENLDDSKLILTIGWKNSVVSILHLTKTDAVCPESSSRPNFARLVGSGILKEWIILLFWSFWISRVYPKQKPFNSTFQLIWW